MRFTLRQLDVFLAIARHSTTSMAAEELHMSQSAVSAALQTLEKSYDMQLFDRVGKRLELNEIGNTLRKRAETLLVHAREFEQDLQGHEQIGHLKIGASYTIANHLAVNYLAGYLERYPQAKVDIVSANSPEIVARVLNYSIDLGMIESEINHPDLDLIPWMDDELIVFASPEHPLARKPRLNDSDLLNARWILREADSGARQTFDRVFARLLTQLDIYLQFRHNEPIKKAVESGLGIGCLSEKVLQSNFRDGSLVPLQVPKKFRMQRTFYFALMKSHFRKAPVDYWLSLCLENLS